MNIPLRRKLLTIGICVCVWSGGHGLAGSRAYADAAPTQNDIRVALFIDTKDYSKVTPAVTISATGGLTVGADGKGAFETQNAKPVRLSLDQYMVQVLETGDEKQAQDAYERLASKKLPTIIWKLTKSGSDVFQVQVGPFATLESASAAKENMTASGPLQPLPSASAITGPLRWNAGTYATEQEASAQLAAIGKAGFDAFIALPDTAAGQPGYAVWIGGEPDQTRLAALKQQIAKALPALVLQPVDPKVPYLLKRLDATPGTNGAEIVEHYTFNAAGQKVWIRPKQGKLTVREKNGQAYRGGLELSQWNGKLAVVNELPLEQYLYAVVSSEMSTGWPQEALKAQAVAARTFAVRRGLAYGIANVTDTTLDQAYEGKEYDDVIRAVDATKGEVLVDAAGKPIEALFSSNAGGMTADNAEAWKGQASYFKATSSPDDGDAQGRAIWRRVALADGRTGYVRADLLKDTGNRNPLGLSIYTAAEPGVNVREAPYTWDAAKNPGFAKLNPGDTVVAFAEERESNSYNWLSVPMSGSELLAGLNKQLTAQSAIAGPLLSLQVASRGPSGRVTMLKANGKEAALKYPDSYRSALGGLRSTLFEIEETGRYTILGAGGRTTSHPETNAAPAIAPGGQPAPNAATGNNNLFVLGKEGKLRVVTSEPQYVFRGRGFGHGLGMSQWGARGYAELGYDYRYILQNYYAGTSLVKQ